MLIFHSQYDRFRSKPHEVCKYDQAYSHFNDYTSYRLFSGLSWPLNIRPLKDEYLHDDKNFGAQNWETVLWNVRERNQEKVQDEAADEYNFDRLEFLNFCKELY